MTIEEIKKAKRILEAKIAKQLEDFQTKTGVTKLRVEFEMVDITIIDREIERTYVPQVNITLEI